MAARAKRAVRIDPGCFADRRASAGELDRDLGRLPAFSRLPSLPQDVSPSPSATRMCFPQYDGIETSRAKDDDFYHVISDLERYRGTFQILLFLHREGPATAHRMRQRLRPGPEAIHNCLNHLTRTGLVRPTRSQTFPFGRSYELTDLGNEVVLSPVRSWPYVLVK